MIPLCDLVPSRTRPVAVLVLAAVTVVESVAVWSLTGDGTGPAAIGLSPAGWRWTGVLVSPAVQPGVLVLAADLIALWLFGPTVEDRLGHFRFTALWVASGIAAAGVQIAVGPLSIGVLLGGMGATAGAVAANLVLHPRGRILAATPVFIGFEFVDLPSWLYACVWLTVVIAASPGVPASTLLSVFAAGGGIGAAAGALLQRPERMGVEWWGA